MPPKDNVTIFVIQTNQPKDYKMRTITRESITAFNNAKSFKKQNMSVEVLPNVTILKLHGNSIAYQYNDPEKTKEGKTDEFECLGYFHEGVP